MYFVDAANVLKKLDDAKIKLNDRLINVLHQTTGNSSLQRVYVYTTEKEMDTYKTKYPQVFEGCHETL